MKPHVLLISLFSLLCFSLTSSSLHATYGGLSFGDNEDTVIKKLEKSKLVETDIPKTMFARVGLNGTFTTKKAIKSMKFSLYFDWDRNGANKALKQIILRSDPQNMSEYSSALKSSWQYTINLITSIYGRPMRAGAYPAKNSLQDGGIQYSHEWKTDSGYIYLGTARLDGRSHLSISFNRDSLTGR